MNKIMITAIFVLAYLPINAGLFHYRLARWTATAIGTFFTTSPVVLQTAEACIRIVDKIQGIDRKSSLPFLDPLSQEFFDKLKPDPTITFHKSNDPGYLSTSIHKVIIVGEMEPFYKNLLPLLQEKKALLQQKENIIQSNATNQIQTDEQNKNLQMLNNKLNQNEQFLQGHVAIYDHENSHIKYTDVHKRLGTSVALFTHNVAWSKKLSNLLLKSKGLLKFSGSVFALNTIASLIYTSVCHYQEYRADKNIRNEIAPLEGMKQILNGWDTHKKNTIAQLQKDVSQYSLKERLKKASYYNYLTSKASYKYPLYWDVHPAPQNRIQRIQQRIDKLKAEKVSEIKSSN